MTLETNLSRRPYFDTFEANSNHHQVLFRPSVAVQTRELNELQSIAQDQIEKFGKHIFVDGSVVDGCSLSYNNKAHYVKVLDNYANGTALTLSDLNGFYVRNDLGVKAIIYKTIDGFQTQSPDLNTIYVNYISANGTNKIFQPDDILTVYNSANATVGEIVVANTSIAGNSGPIGYGYVCTVEDGVIFQKGYFISNPKQSLVISKYDNKPSGISVGFRVDEILETPESNTALLDNAAGSPNYTAPGAHRLKLVPVLSVRSTLETSNTQAFFAIADFTEGNPSVVRTDAAYANLGKQLAERTYEESGNYIIDPFQIRVVTKYDANNNRVANELKLEIDPGLAYVNGYRVETVGKSVSTIRRGTDVKTVNQAALTASMGNYVFVKEYGGIFRADGSQMVSLRSGAAQALSTASNSFDGLSAPGDEIGTAFVSAIRHDSGQIGHPTTRYALYLYNITMKPGKKFADVRSIYADDGGTKGFADIILTGSNAVLQDTNLQSLVYSFAQKGVKTLGSFTANVSTEFIYRSSNVVTFNVSGEATLTIPSVAGGTNEFPYVGTLTTGQEKDFLIISTSSVDSANLAGWSVSGTSGSNTVVGVGTAFVDQLAVGQLIKIANSSASVVKRITEIIDQNNLRVSNNFSSNYISANLAIALIPGQPINTEAPGVTISASGSSATIDLGQNWNSSFSAIAQYNVRRTVANPKTKTLVKDVMVKIDLATATNKNTGPWCLGLPDVFKIKHVYSGTTYSTSNPDMVSSFKLDNGQRDGVYDLAYLSKKSGISLPTNGKLLVVMDIFQTVTSQGTGYFCVDSYPIDDTGVTPNTILTEEIPIYKSSTGSYDLRDSVDFRLTAANTANVATTAAGATVNPSSVLTINQSLSGYVPNPDSSFESDMEYYVGRYDKVGIDSRGTIKVLEGAPSESPTLPADIPNMITLAAILVPPYPSLGGVEARRAQRYDYSTNISYYKNRRYTMRDIAGLDSRIEKLEYYTSLSVLELSSKSLLIESSTGGNRFQNGLLVDPFRGHDIGNQNDPQYAIAIDSELSEARPKNNRVYIDSKYNTSVSTNTQRSANNRLVTLAYTEKEDYIVQPFASKVRNCAQEEMYVWIGTLQLSPEGDWRPDITVNPEVKVDLDLYSNFIGLQNAWGTQWGDWNETSRSAPRTSSAVTENIDMGGVGTLRETTTTTVTDINQRRTGTSLNVTKENNTFSFGSYVTDLSLEPYIRPRRVSFVVQGMKPNCELFAFFDDVPVTEFCNQTYFNEGTEADFRAGRILRRKKLITDDEGSLAGTFSIPRETFLAGEREFKLVDVDNLVTESEAIQSRAVKKYIGTNISYSKNNITLNTTEPQFSARTQSDTRTVSTVSTQTNFAYIAPPAPVDPIMQTFSIIEPAEIPGIYATSVEFFFNTKHPTLGVIVEIREVVNGYPSLKVLPHSTKSLRSRDVQISDDASKPTKFVFDSPVFLENGKEYCLVVMPAGSNSGYTIWIGEQGGVDVSSGATIFKNSTIGVMFTSSNNKTWTPFQKEDIKFKLNRASFTSLTGTAVFNNDDCEFISAASIVGTFEPEEDVYVSNNLLTNTASVSNSSTIVSNVSTTGLTAALTDALIYIQSNTGVISQVRAVESIINSTAISINAAPSFTDSSASVGIMLGKGAFTGTIRDINYVNNFVVMANSTANSTTYLTSNCLVIAANSGSSIRVDSVEDVVWSTYMPKFSVSTPPGTAFKLGVIGRAKNGALDSAAVEIPLEVEYSFIDKERVVRSKSNELLYNSGVKSLRLNVQLSSFSEKYSPAVDTIKSDSIVIGNVITDDEQGSAIIKINSANGNFQAGDIIRNSASTANGTVVFSKIANNAGYIVVDTNAGVFTQGSTIINTSVAGANVTANVQNIEFGTLVEQSERTPGSGTAVARYISKRVVLADGLDAEDLKVFVAAYKPQGTDVYVYAKFWNSTDSETFEQKQWTQLVTTNKLVSSRTNSNDFIEYEYNLPTEQPLDLTAWSNQNNSGIIRYLGPEGEIYDLYKTFAIKIVLVSRDTALVPRVQDYRAIAVSV